MTQAYPTDVRDLRRRVEGRQQRQAASGDPEHLRDQFSDFFDFSPTGFVSLNGRGAILQINLTGARLLGMERARLVGGRLAAFVDSRDRARFNAFLEQVFTMGAERSCRVILAGRDQAPRTIHLEAAHSHGWGEGRIVLVDTQGWDEAPQRSEPNPTAPPDC